MSDEPSKQKWWHVYGQEVEGVYMTIVLGPSDQSPRQVKANKPRVGDTEYVRSFDHEPNAFEKDQLQPEEFREYDAGGRIFEPTLVVTSTSSEGVEVTVHHPLTLGDIMRLDN